MDLLQLLELVEEVQVQAGFLQEVLRVVGQAVVVQVVLV